MQAKLPITQRQFVEVRQSARGTVISVGTSDYVETAELEPEQLADLIEMLQLCQASHKRRKG